MSGKGKAVLAALVTISAFAVSCGKDSNMVAVADQRAAAMSVAGTWSGHVRVELDVVRGHADDDHDPAERIQPQRATCTTAKPVRAARRL